MTRAREPGFPKLSIVDLLTALRRRWPLAALVALAIVAITAASAFTQPRIYQASASLLFDAADTDPVDEDKSASLPASFLGTQEDIIRSSMIAQEVAQRLGLDEAERRRAGASAERLPEIRRRLGRGLIGGLEVRAGRQSNVAVLAYRSPDAVEAARIANAFAEVYLQKHLELRVAPARSFSRWFDEQTGQARARLEAAQARLSTYQRQRGIIGVNRMDLEADRLRALSAELSQAEAASAEASARAASPNGPEVNASPVVQGLRTNIAGKQAQIAELSRTLGANHPAMRAAQAELAALQGELSNALSVARSSLGSARVAARAHETELRARVGAQQQRMLQMSPDQDELMVLQRDVDAARQAYDAIRQRMSETALRSQVAQTNVSLLDRAQVPVLPVSPNIPLLLFLGAVLGGIVGVSVVLLLELLRPRIRTVRGIEAITGVPVLADLSRTSRALRIRTAGDREEIAA